MENHVPNGVTIDFQIIVLYITFSQLFVDLHDITESLFSGRLSIVSKFYS